MREIKFRFWNGYEIKPVRVINFNYDFYEDDHSHISDVENIEKSPFLMQYTGLKDKNGKEIYEGDIVKCEEVTGLYSIAIPEIYVFLHCADIFPNQLEVVGNIYENPELIKGDDL